MTGDAGGWGWDLRCLQQSFICGSVEISTCVQLQDEKVSSSNASAAFYPLAARSLEETLICSLYERLVWIQTSNIRTQEPMLTTDVLHRMSDVRDADRLQHFSSSEVSVFLFKTFKYVVLFMWCICMMLRQPVVAHSAHWGKDETVFFFSINSKSESIAVRHQSAN